MLEWKDTVSEAEWAHNDKESETLGISQGLCSLLLFEGSSNCSSLKRMCDPCSVKISSHCEPTGEKYLALKVFGLSYLSARFITLCFKT